MSYRTLQYQVKAEPVPLGATETTTPDKWQAEVLDNPVRRQPFIVAAITSLAFVPVLAAPATPVYVNSQSCEPIAVRSYQYQAKAEPVAAPAAPPEEVTADKWLTAWPQPYFRRNRLIQYGVNCAIAEHLDEGTAPVHWIPQTNVPYFRRPPLRDYGLWVKSTLTPTDAEAITPDKWSQPLQRPVDRKRNHAIFPVSVRDLIGRAETVSLDRFQQPQAQPRRDLFRRQFLFPVSVSDYLSEVPGAEVIRLDKWGKNYPDLISRVRRLPDYTQYAIDSTLRAERASLDKWAQQTNTPRFDVKRNQWLYPAFTSDAQLHVQPGVEIIQVDKWAQPQSQPTRKVGSIIVEPLDVLRVAELITSDKWFQPVAIPRQDLNRLQHLYPSLAIDAAFYLVPVGVTDWLAVSKDIRAAILFTSHTGTGILTVADFGADPATLFTQDVRDEP